MKQSIVAIVLFFTAITAVPEPLQPLDTSEIRCIEVDSQLTCRLEAA